MPSIERPACKTPLSWFNKRGNSADQLRDKNDIPPGEALVIVIAGLTLLVAMVPLFRSLRFRHWVSRSRILSFCKKALGITPINPAPITVTPEEHLSAIPAAGIPMLDPVFIHDGNSSADLAGTLSVASPYGRNGIAGDVRAPRVGEPLGPRRPEPVVTWRSL